MYDNASLEKPEVLIQQLEAGKAYIATVTALNKKVILSSSSSSSSPSSSSSSSLFLSSTFSFFQGASLSVHKMVETLQQPELQLVEEKIEVRLMMLMMEKALMMMEKVLKMLMMMVKMLVLIVQGYNCVNANLKRAPLAFPSKMQKATFFETINRCNVQHITIMLKINLNFPLYTANKFSQYVKTWQLAIFSHSFIPGR